VSDKRSRKKAEPPVVPIDPRTAGSPQAVPPPDDPMERGRSDESDVRGVGLTEQEMAQRRIAALEQARGTTANSAAPGINQPKDTNKPG
jgi:hypothetical protein